MVGPTTSTQPPTQKPDFDTLRQNTKIAGGIGARRQWPPQKKKKCWLPEVNPPKALAALHPKRPEIVLPPTRNKKPNPPFVIFSPPTQLSPHWHPEEQETTGRSWAHKLKMRAGRPPPTCICYANRIIQIKVTTHLLYSKK